MARNKIKKSDGFFSQEVRMDHRGKGNIKNLKPLKVKSIDRYGNMVIVEFSRQVVMAE